MRDPNQPFCLTGWPKGQSDRPKGYWRDQDAAGKTWFPYLPFLAPHKPWGCPREGLGAPYTDETFECDPDAMTDNDDFDFRSMITAIDIEIDRLLNNPRQEDGIEWDPADTLVIVTSDNGSPTERVSDDPFSPSKAKGSVAQGGVWVPLVIGGAGVTDVGQRVTASVSLADLYATILDVAGKSTLPPQDSDSVSLTPFFADAGATRILDFNYTETFFPNFEAVADPQADQHGPCRGSQAVQEDPALYPQSTFKYVRQFGGATEALYDLDVDPFESNNLIGNPPDALRLQALEDEIDLGLQSDLASLCRGKLATGQPCQANADCCSNVCSLGAAAPVCVCETS